MSKRAVSYLATAIILFLVAGPAFAGACLCVKRNMEGKTVAFECTEIAGGGHAECSQHCQAAGYNGYEWFDDETCDSLHQKIKSQKIKIKIKDIVKVVQQVKQLAVSGDGEADSGLAAISTTDPRTVETYNGTIEGIYDTFDVPDAYGGGSFTTTTFSGSIGFRLDPDPGNPDRYFVTVVSASTTAPSMNVNGFETGTLHGYLNSLSPSTGEYNTRTGDVSILFSQRIYADNLPGIEIKTWSHYFGTCLGCLPLGELPLDADSFYIFP